MAFQQSDLDLLDSAIASGVRSVTFADGRRTEWQNTSEMLAARKVIAAAVVGASPSSQGRRRFIVGRVGRR